MPRAPYSRAVRKFYQLVAIVILAVLGSGSTWFGVVHNHEHSAPCVTCKCEHEKTPQPQHHDDCDHRDCAACTWQLLSLDDATPMPILVRPTFTIAETEFAADVVALSSDFLPFSAERAPPALG